MFEFKEIKPRKPWNEKIKLSDEDMCTAAYETGVIQGKQEILLELRSILATRTDTCFLEEKQGLEVAWNIVCKMCEKAGCE